MNLPDIDEVAEVQTLRLGPRDALVIRFPGAMSEDELVRFRSVATAWIEKTFGRKVPCLVLEGGASIEVLRDAVAEVSSPAMPRAEQEGIR